MSDRLKLSDPKSDAEVERVALAQELLADHQKIRALEQNIATLEKELAKQERSVPPFAAPPQNKIGARKQGAFMAINTAPSINKTPIGPSMVPIPYPTVQDLTNSTETAKTVNFNGCPAYLLDCSKQSTCKGDAPGTGKGVRSGTVSGEVKPVQGSKTVRIEGKRVVREGDACTMNGGNNPGVYVATSPPISSPAQRDPLPDPNHEINSSTQTWNPENPLGLAELSKADKLNQILHEKNSNVSSFRPAIYNISNKLKGPMLVPLNTNSKEAKLLRTRNSLSIALLGVFGGMGAAARLSGQTEEQVAAANEAGASLMGVATSLSGMPARSAGKLVPQQMPKVTSGVKILPRTLIVPMIPQRVLAARARQEKMLNDDAGYNISPTAWDAYPTIGRNGTFISDSTGILGYFKSIPSTGKITISKYLAAKIELDTGLEPGTLQAGFKVRKISSIKSANPRSPLEGNKYFLGKGQHLPGGAPEVVIDSVPTKDSSSVKTIVEVEVK